MLVHSKCSKNGDSLLTLNEAQVLSGPQFFFSQLNTVTSGRVRGVRQSSRNALVQLSCLLKSAHLTPSAKTMLLFKASDTRRGKPLWGAVTVGSWLTGFVYTQVLSMGSLTFWRMSFNSMKVIVCTVALGETELNKGHEGLGLCWEETRWWGCFMSSKSWADIGGVARWVVITWADGGGGRHFLPQSDCLGISSDL